MNKTINTVCLTTAFLSSSLFAGGTSPLVYHPTDTPSPQPATSSGSADLVDFSINARLRYEFREAGLADASHAGTLRVRPGITILPDGPFSLFAEGEFTTAFLDDFNSGPQATLSPNVTGNTNILDPESEELNQAYAQFKDHGFTARVGRQRIIADNARFVGNVGWRQNEQTFDAASLSFKSDELFFSYSYSNKAIRLFGSDATAQVGELEGEMHFFNGYK